MAHVRILRGGKRMSKIHYTVGLATGLAVGALAGIIVGYGKANQAWKKEMDRQRRKAHQKMQRMGPKR